MPRWLKFTAIGCGGLFSLFILFTACALILGGSSDSPDQAQDDAAPSEEEASEPAANIGDTVKVGNVAWQVTTARQATELKSEFSGVKQGNFVIVDFLFTNNDKEAVTLDSVSISLLDGEGRKSEADTDSYEYIDPAKDIFLDQVNPGVTQEGEVIYTVAPGAKGFKVEVGDAALFSDEKKTINLGF